jgi:hypothetical protein
MLIGYLTAGGEEGVSSSNILGKRAKAPSSLSIQRKRPITFH